MRKERMFELPFKSVVFENIIESVTPEYFKSEETKNDLSTKVLYVVYCTQSEFEVLSAACVEMFGGSIIL